MRRNIKGIPFYRTVSNFTVSAEVICSARCLCDVLRTLLLRKWQPWGARHTKKINGRIRLNIWVKLTIKAIALCCRLCKPGFYNSRRLVAGALLCRCILVLQCRTASVKILVLLCMLFGDAHRILHWKAANPNLTCLAFSKADTWHALHFGT